MEAIIKAWIHTESDRGLQRAILILQALTKSDADNANKKEVLKSHVLDSLSEWSTKLLDKQMAARAVDGKLELYTRKKIANNQQHQEPFVMNPRMALMNAAMQGNETGIQPFNEEKQEPIGPLPHIEPAVSPNLISFQLVLSGESSSILYEYTFISPWWSNYYCNCSTRTTWNYNIGKAITRFT